MSSLATESKKLADLRSRAAARLRGPSGQPGASFNAADALAVLHAMASSPATSADALAMLHELQVHQVELDLQAEELRDSRADLESALRRQTELYDFQPVCCFTVDRKLAICELNRAAAQRLGIARDDALGLPLDGFLSPAGAEILHEAIAATAAGQCLPAPVLQWTPPGGPPGKVRAHLAADTFADRFLLVLTPADELRDDPAAQT